MNQRISKRTGAATHTSFNIRKRVYHMKLLYVWFVFFQTLFSNQSKTFQHLLICFFFSFLFGGNKIYVDLKRFYSYICLHIVTLCYMAFFLNIQNVYSVSKINANYSYSDYYSEFYVGLR